MKITVTTDTPNYFVEEVRKLLHSKGSISTHVDDLLIPQIDGQSISWQRLSIAQFNAVEDTAVRMGLEYDGSQEEQQTMFDFQPICEQMQEDGVEITPDSLCTYIRDLYAGLWEQLGDYPFGIVAGWLDRQKDHRPTLAQQDTTHYIW